MKKHISISIDCLSPEMQNLGLAHKYNALIDDYNALEKKYLALIEKASVKVKSAEKVK